MNPSIQLTKAIPLFLVSLACLALSPTAKALLPAPPPDGGYPNGNTAEGDAALFNLTTGFNNSATGLNALSSNTTGSANTAAGADALRSNTTGTNNTVYGAEAMPNNQAGWNNTAYGAYTLLNSTVSDNTALGTGALRENRTGTANTAVGESALSQNNSGTNNTALGTDASHENNGDRNVAVGYSALSNNVTGSRNTVIGADAMHNDIVGVVTGNGNTAVGSGALRDTAGNNNLALGHGGGGNLLVGDNNILIANAGVAEESNTIRIGDSTNQQATFIAGIYGVHVTGLPVVIDANGQMGTTTTIQDGVQTGTIICVDTSAPAPSGYTLLGTTRIHYRTTSGRNAMLNVNLYQKN